MRTPVPQPTKQVTGSPKQIDVSTATPTPVRIKAERPATPLRTPAAPQPAIDLPKPLPRPEILNPGIKPVPKPISQPIRGTEPLVGKPTDDRPIVAKPPTKSLTPAPSAERIVAKPMPLPVVGSGLVKPITGISKHTPDSSKPRATTVTGGKSLVSPPERAPASAIKPIVAKTIVPAAAIGGGIGGSDQIAFVPTRNLIHDQPRGADYLPPAPQSTFTPTRGLVRSLRYQNQWQDCGPRWDDCRDSYYDNGWNSYSSVNISFNYGWTGSWYSTSYGTPCFSTSYGYGGYYPTYGYCGPRWSSAWYDPCWRPRWSCAPVWCPPYRPVYVAPACGPYRPPVWCATTVCDPFLDCAPDPCWSDGCCDYWRPANCVSVYSGFCDPVINIGFSFSW